MGDKPYSTSLSVVGDKPGDKSLLNTLCMVTIFYAKQLYIRYLHSIIATFFKLPISLVGDKAGDKE